MNVLVFKRLIVLFACGILLFGTPQALIGQEGKEDCTKSCLNYPECFDPNIPCKNLTDKECKEGCPNYPCCIKEGLPCGDEPCNREPDCNPLVADWPDCAKESTPDPLTVVDKEGSQGVLRYEKYEVGFNLPDRNFENRGQIGYVNPYNPNLISVEAEFISPYGVVYEVNGFYYKPFVRIDDMPYWNPLQNFCPWRVRFAPNQIGDWKYSIKVVEEGVITYESEMLSFECIVSDNPGPLRVSRNNRYLEFKNGDSFFAISQDLRGEVNAGNKSVFPSDCPNPNPLNCSETDGWCFNPNTLKTHLQHIHDFKAHGGNMVRIWIEPHTYEFEWEHLGNYDTHQNKAFDLDELIEYCQEEDIYIHLVTKGVVNLERKDWSKQGGGWAQNPYHTQAPLQLDVPFQFFTDEEAKELYKRRLRYMVARWGYSTAIATYSLMNEPEFYANCEEPLFDCTDNVSYNNSRPELFAWFREMGQYLRGISFEQKMLTIDFASTSRGDDVIADPLFDFSNGHLYTRDLHQNYQYAYEINWNKEFWNKPTTISESGEGVGGASPWISEERETSLHHSIWSTALSGGFGTSFYFGSTAKFNHPCHGAGPRYYRPLSIFLDGETFNSEDHPFSPISNAQAGFDEFVQRDNPPWNYDPPSPPAGSGLPDIFDRCGYAIQRYGECSAINEDFLTEDITTTDNERIQVFALQNTNRVLGWVHNKLYYWYNVEHNPDPNGVFMNARLQPMNYPDPNPSSNCVWFDGVDVTSAISNPTYTVPTLEGETMTISNLHCSGFYQVEWYSTYPAYDINGDGTLEDGGRIDALTTVAFASNGKVDITIPRLTPIENTTDAQPFAPSYGFKLIYIGETGDSGSWQHDWPGGRNNNRLVGGDISIHTPNDNNQVFYRNENGMIRHLFPSTYTNFIYGALNHWNQPLPHRLDPESPIHVNSQDQVFYIGADERLQYYYWSPNGGAGQWTHAWVGGESANYSVKGDFAIDPVTDDLFFRNGDGHLHRFSLQNNTWVEDDLGLSNPTLSQLVAANSEIQINSWGQVFYQGDDAKLQYFRPSGNQWIHAWLSPNDNHFVVGPFVVHAQGGNNQIFYRSHTGYMRHYYSVNGGASWAHTVLSAWSQPSKHKVDVESPIRVNGFDQVFYKGTDGKMQYYFWTSGTGWEHDWPGGEANNYQVDGDIGINNFDSNHIFYRDGDGYLRHFSPINGGAEWEYDDLTLDPAQTEIEVAKSSPIRVNTQDQAFYEGEDGKMQVYYWYDACAHTGSGFHNDVPSDALQYKTDLEEEKPEAISTLEVFPNPASDRLTINWELPKAGEVELYLTDVYGKRRDLVVKENAPAGVFTITASIQEYTNGFYLLYGVLDGELVVSRKIVIHH